MKRRSLTLLLLGLAASGPGCGGGGGSSAAGPGGGSGTEPPPAGMRDLTSLQLSQLMGAGWNLGNSLEAIGGETAWGNAATTQRLIDAVKAAGVVQGFNTNIDHTVTHAVMPTDTAANRLMMEVHFYDPFDFTLNAQSTIWQWGAAATDPRATEPWAHEAHVDAQFEKMKTRFVDRGIPVILGEYGAMRRTEYPGAETYRTNWDRHVTRAAWARGAVPVYWDAGAATDNHSTGLFDRSTGAQVHPALISAIVESAK